MKISYQDLPQEILRRKPPRVVWGISRTWGALFALFFLAGVSEGILAQTAIIVLIGTFQYHLNILGHDGIHFNLFENKSCNDFVTTWVLMGPQGIPLKPSRINHLHHHRTVGTLADQDRHYYDLEYFNRQSQLGMVRW